MSEIKCQSVSLILSKIGLLNSESDDWIDQIDQII
jgi:hypothetical protein